MAEALNIRIIEQLREEIGGICRQDECHDGNRPYEYSTQM
jgi:hypothetical protein